MQKLWEIKCDSCGKVIYNPFIEVTTTQNTKRHYCNDECRLKHSEKNVKQINYIK